MRIDVILVKIQAPKGLSNSVSDRLLTPESIDQCHLVNGTGRREEHKMLKEPVKKRRHLTRFLTSLVSVTLFTERKRGDGAFYVPHGVRYR